MCRWFVYISPTEPCLLSDVLITPVNSITHQVSEHYLPGLLPHDQDHDLHDAKDALLRKRNSVLNMDGMGIAWYTPSQSNFMGAVSGDRPAMYKSTSPLMNDFNLHSICENTESNCIFAHIRASSGAALAHVNCHPFVFGRHTFMHNGVVTDFLEIKRPLCEVYNSDEYANIRGSTDSEHLAALFMHYLTGGRGKESWQEVFAPQAMADALTKTVVHVCQLQKKLLGARARPNSLNLAVTDGKKLIAIRFRNHRNEEPPSLYYSETAGVTLNSKYPGHPNKDQVNTNAVKESREHGKHLILASEPTAEVQVKTDWSLVPKNHLVCNDEHGQLSLSEVMIDASLMARDPDDEATTQNETQTLRCSLSSCSLSSWCMVDAQAAVDSVVDDFGG